ncbi:MAG: cytochrome c [Acidimicrobiia bacterium]|nr:cytochrome c [Acidimicrobiia bacterium]
MRTGVLGGLLLVAAGAGVQAGQAVDLTSRLVLPAMSGRDTYSYFCASCHGPDGRGDGPLAQELRTLPADLRALAASNGGNYPSERVREVLTHGRAAIPAHGSVEMPIWGPIFRALDPSDEAARVRIAGLVTYLGSIQSR